MKRAIAVLYEWNSITWMRIAAVAATATFVTYMCFQEIIQGWF
jgi:hypothetical protein